MSVPYYTDAAEQEAMLFLNGLKARCEAGSHVKMWCYCTFREALDSELERCVKVVHNLHMDRALAKIIEAAMREGR